MITFEHDYYSGHGCSRAARNISRELLPGAGYEMVVGDVQSPESLRFMPDNDLKFEDWWVDPEVIDPAVLQIYRWSDHHQRSRTYDNILFTA